MQHRPLLISGLITHAARCHGATGIVSRTVEGPIHRTTWRGVEHRARGLAAALADLGIAAGDRVATLAWNGYRHLELYYAVIGSGAVLHTVNPRLFPEQIEYILAHGGAACVCFDINLAPLVERLRPALPQVRHWIAMTDAAHMPVLPDLLCYESLLAAATPIAAWPEFEETRAAALCYTSGTTGDPKGALYSHRSAMLQAYAMIAADCLALSARSSVLVVVPLFHVNAWGLPFTGAMVGAKLVLPGPKLDGPSLDELLTAERCNFAVGVPTVWLALLDHIDAARGPAAPLPLERVMVGGSAAPRRMIERFAAHGTTLIHGWGMTELSPIGTINTPLPRHDALTAEALLDLQEKQGRVPYGIEMKIVDAEGVPLPHDGTAFGELKVRGHWVIEHYYGGHEALDREGWFATGDVATIDPDGYLHIVDRSKDVIKSGGEWISSIDMENAALGFAGVLEAAVIGVPHPKWDERPILLLRCAEGVTIDPDAMRAYLAKHLAKWWLPDEVLTVPDLPHTATGKLLKTRLRELYRNILSFGR